MPCVAIHSAASLESCQRNSPKKRASIHVELEMDRLDFDHPFEAVQMGTGIEGSGEIAVRPLPADQRSVPRTGGIAHPREQRATSLMTDGLEQLTPEWPPKRRRA